MACVHTYTRSLVAAIEKQGLFRASQHICVGRQHESDVVQYLWQAVTTVVRIRPSANYVCMNWQESFRDLYRKGQLEGTEVMVEVPSPKLGGGNALMVGLPDVSFRNPESTTAIPPSFPLFVHLTSRTVHSYALLSRCWNACLEKECP